MNENKNDTPALEKCTQEEIIGLAIRRYEATSKEFASESFYSTLLNLRKELHASL